MRYSTVKIFKPILILLCVAGSLTCTKHSASSTKRYPFAGRVVSVDKPSQSAVIDGDTIQGFMEAMTMTYKVKSADEFSHLTPGDSVSAEIVVVQADERDEPNYWLENVKVTGHSNPAQSKPASQLHVPSPGDDVPDFRFVNQDGRSISLHQYRGKVLFVTFIYTRCPFPDYCPRVGAHFAELNRQLASDASLSSKTHLLCVSFDPQHDSPKVLREYAFSLAHNRLSALFNRWEFAAPRAADLPQIASYFALTYEPDSGLITHSLSTAVIGPSGKIVSWYPGSDWQVSDLMKDASGALSVQG